MDDLPGPVGADGAPPCALFTAGDDGARRPIVPVRVLWGATARAGEFGEALERCEACPPAAARVGPKVDDLAGSCGLTCCLPSLFRDAPDRAPCTVTLAVRAGGGRATALTTGDRTIGPCDGCAVAWMADLALAAWAAAWSRVWRLWSTAGLPRAIALQYL